MRYLFIDGAYITKRYTEAMQRVFSADGELDLSRVQLWCASNGHPVRRVFYYDCLADIKRERESETEFHARLEQQKERFDRIQSLSGFHVRLGKLTGTRSLRQKGVDVLLAVDMLDHAFRKNMEEVYLLAGDADFVPLVEAVTRVGTWVNVVYDPRASAKALYGDQIALGVITASRER